MICPVCCLKGFDELAQQFDVALTAKSTLRKCRAGRLLTTFSLTPNGWKSKWGLYKTTIAS